jgi:hypothetical protein
LKAKRSKGLLAISQENLMDSETALEFTKLKMQVRILQNLVLRLDVMVPFLTGKQGFDASRERTLAVLKESASDGEHGLMSDPDFKDLGSAERALYADEFREILEVMKSYVSGLSLKK